MAAVDSYWGLTEAGSGIELYDIRLPAVSAFGGRLTLSGSSAAARWSDRIDIGNTTPLGTLVNIYTWSGETRMRFGSLRAALAGALRGVFDIGLAGAVLALVSTTLLPGGK